MCLGALHVRTEGGPSLAGPLSEHHEMQLARDGLRGGWQPMSMDGKGSMR